MKKKAAKKKILKAKQPRAKGLLLLDAILKQLKEIKATVATTEIYVASMDSKIEASYLQIKNLETMTHNLEQANTVQKSTLNELPEGSLV